MQKQEFNQHIHVEGNAYIENNVKGGSHAEDNLLGLFVAIFGVLCGLGLLVAFVVHVLAMIGQFFTAHATEIVVGTLATALIGGGIYYQLTRKRHVETPTLPAAHGLFRLRVGYRRKPGAEPAAIRAAAPEPAFPASQRLDEPRAQKPFPSREIEDVTYVETPIIYPRGVADPLRRSHPAHNDARV